MTGRVIFLCLLFCSFVGIAQTKADAIIGVWLTQVKDAKIEIYKKDNLYYGKVVWIESPTDENGKPKVDSKNPNKTAAKRPIMGMDIVTRMAYSNGEWSGGKIYDPKSGDTYTCKIWLDNGNLKVRGYLGWLYDTKTWTKSI